MLRDALIDPRYRSGDHGRALLGYHGVALRRRGITGWRRNQALFGRPDFVFPHIKLAVFVDGCFWHACPTHCNMPVQNRRFWKRKLDANRRRDRLVRRTLESHGWRVVRVWEHELSPRNQRRLLRRIGVYARGDCPRPMSPFTSP